MRRWRLFLSSVLVLSLFALAGCNAQTDEDLGQNRPALICRDCDPGDPPPECNPGQQATCTLASGCSGLKTCTSNSTWGACGCASGSTKICSVCGRNGTVACDSTCSAPAAGAVCSGSRPFEICGNSCDDNSNGTDERNGEACLDIGCPIPGKHLSRTFYPLPTRTCLDPVSAHVGEKLYATAAGAYSDSMLIIQMLSNNVWNDFAYTNVSHTRIIELNISVSYEGTYRACAYGTNYPVETSMRLGFDVAGVRPEQDRLCAAGATVGGSADRCFGAVGANCDTAYCAPAVCPGSEELCYRCAVSVGAQAHDTCCARHRNGSMCGGGVEMCSDGQQCCTDEWNEAFWDTTFGHQWDVFFDPTVINYEYRDAIGFEPASYDSYYHGPPVANSLRAPSGVSLDPMDAPEWCASGAISGSGACQ